MTSPEGPQQLVATVMVWNLDGGFSRPERAGALLQRVLSIDPGIASFPQAAFEGHALPAEIQDGLEGAGYVLHESDNEDADGREDRQKLLLAIKEAIPHTVERIRLAGRYALLAHLDDPDTDLLAGHLNDRDKAVRLQQSEEAIALLGPRAVVAMTANAMHRNDPRARLLRAAGPFARRLPAADPRPGVRQPRLERAGSLLQRSVEMADGKTMELWTRNGFRDTVGSAPTSLLGGRRALSLDRILIRGHDMFAHPARILPAKGLTRHSAVVV